MDIYGYIYGYLIILRVYMDIYGCVCGYLDDLRKFYKSVITRGFAV